MSIGKYAGVAVVKNHWRGAKTDTTRYTAKEALQLVSALAGMLAAGYPEIDVTVYYTTKTKRTTVTSSSEPQSVAA